MNNKTITKELEIKLTITELLEISQKIVANSLELDRIESLKKQIPLLRESISELSNKYNSGTDIRPVECSVFYNNPGPGRKSIIRNDTYETIETLNMEPEDYQGEFDFDQSADSSDSNVYKLSPAEEYESK